jgi:hypothetical protein
MGSWWTLRDVGKCGEEKNAVCHNSFHKTIRSTVPSGNKIAIATGVMWLEPLKDRASGGLLYVQ